MNRLPVRLHDFGTMEALEEHVLAHGCYSPEENSLIFHNCFQQRPPLSFVGAARKYGITSKRLCDVGCAYGSVLVYCAPGSYGIEVEYYEVRFANSIGLKVVSRDVVNDMLSDLPAVEVVWCRDLLEHVESPHVVLRKLYSLLEPGGLIFVAVSTIPPLPALTYLPVVGRYFRGHLHRDHINAFTLETLRFTCERAGFETIELTPLYPGPFSIFNKVFRPFVGIVFVGRKIEAWEYPKKASRTRADNIKGYDFKGQGFPEPGVLCGPRVCYSGVAPGLRYSTDCCPSIAPFR